jgi:hypothetical protein
MNRATSPGRGGGGLRRLEPLHGKNIWRICKAYGRLIGVPELKPHDLRQGVAMEMIEQHHDLEQGRACSDHGSSPARLSLLPTERTRGGIGGALERESNAGKGDERE